MSTPAAELDRFKQVKHCDASFQTETVGTVIHIQYILHIVHHLFIIKTEGAC